MEPDPRRPVAARRLLALTLLAAGAVLPGCGTDTAESGAESVRPTHMDSMRSTLSDRKAATNEIMDHSLAGRGNASANSSWMSDLWPF